jgi:hypothetical protein
MSVGIPSILLYQNFGRVLLAACELYTYGDRWLPHRWVNYSLSQLQSLLTLAHMVLIEGILTP